jgi:hypothetical protein
MSYPYFEDIYINFENSPLNNNISGNPCENEFFGILKMVAPSCKITEATQELIFVIDRSGSMGDLCSDGRTKMHHIIYTLKNMILYLNDLNNNVNNINNINFYITIFAFDNKFSHILKRIIVNNESVEEMIRVIENIRPQGSTNIEIALTNVKEYIGELRGEYPHHNISHIFMTDGEATDGISDCDALKDLVCDDSVINAFIGFGINHDAMLLNGISSKKNSSYYFIDILEKAGLVYGEVLHGILYKYLEDVEIEVLNGFIYDFKMNKWTDKLCLGNIVGEANKNFHITSSTPHLCEVIINFIMTDDKLFLCVPKLIDTNTDYTKYLYRQKTLELLFEVSQNQHNVLDSRKNIFSQIVNDDETSGELNILTKREKNENSLKYKLIDLIKDIKKYMQDNGLTEEKFLKNLCDDIYISYKTIGTRYGAMYSCARQVSQGNQRCYNVTQTPKDIGDRDIDDRDIDTKDEELNGSSCSIPKFLSLDKTCLQHNVSDFSDMPYLTPTAAKLMRDISSRGEGEEGDANTFSAKTKSNYSNISYTYSSDEDDNLFTFLTKKKHD